MKRLVVLLFAAIALAGCGSAAAADAAHYENAVFLDVRTPAEFGDGHVDGALLIPVDELEARIGELDALRDERIVLYCRTGRRSGIAMDLLRQHGFTQLENAGAFTRLQGLGLRTSTGAPRAN